MRFSFSDRKKVNYITHVYRGRRSIARRFTSLLIRIYERGVESLQGSAALHPVGKIIVFRAVVPGMYMSDAKGERASSRKKQPDTISVVVESEDETRGSLPAVTCTRARTHAGRQADTRGCERKGVVDDGGGEGGRVSGLASGPIVHARGWVGSLLKCKPEFFSEGSRNRGRKKR